MWACVNVFSCRFSNWLCWCYTADALYLIPYTLYPYPYCFCMYVSKSSICCHSLSAFLFCTQSHTYCVWEGNVLRSDHINENVRKFEFTPFFDIPNLLFIPVDLRPYCCVLNASIRSSWNFFFHNSVQLNR